MKAGNLLLRDREGKVYESSLPIHAMMLDEFDLNPSDIVDSGVVVKGGREMWSIPDLKNRLKAI